MSPALPYPPRKMFMTATQVAPHFASVLGPVEVA